MRDIVRVGASRFPGGQESAMRMSGAFKTNLNVCWTPESDGTVGQIVHQPSHFASRHHRVPETDGKRGLRDSTLAGHLDHLQAYGTSHRYLPTTR